MGSAPIEIDVLDGANTRFGLVSIDKSQGSTWHVHPEKLLSRHGRLGPVLSLYKPPLSITQ